MFHIANDLRLAYTQLMKKSILSDVETVLRDHGFRVTAVRSALLTTLATSKSPLTIAIMAKKIRRHRADTATIYRALTAFVAAGIVREQTLLETAKQYDIVRNTHHEHYIVCSGCKTIESIPFCMRAIESSEKEKSRLFKTVDAHTLSFSGTCRKCARAVR